MSLPPEAFVADAALRLDAPEARPRKRGRLALAVLAALVVEAAVFGMVWQERDIPPPAESAEIPVEIVVEPPPPPEPTPTPDPTSKPQPQQPDLTPGVDAPREGKSDHDAEIGELEKPAPPPPSPAPTPSPEATTPAAEAPAPELPKAAEAEAPPPLKTETPEPQPAAPAPPTVAEVLAKALSQQIDLGGLAMKAPIAGGQARATYFSILVGITKAHERIPAAARTYGSPLVGIIAVTIAGNGRLLTRYVAAPSGSPELDEAEMQAVAEASRNFPPPPGHRQIAATYTYHWP